MRLARQIRTLLEGSEKPVVVTFTGGMGAQIISAAICLSLRTEGRAVYADFSYFATHEYIATAGHPGEISRWPWQLEPFGLTPGSFETAPDLGTIEAELIVDGSRKLALGFEALRQPEIRKHFEIPEGILGILPSAFSSGYVCIHVRRGDYVNVASRLIADREFIDLAANFPDLVHHLAVVTDSPIGEPFRQALGEGYENAVFLDGVDAFTSHRIMRNARILVCSNSQFSLVAALLNHRALVLLPKQWFGDSDRAVEAPIHEVCEFQILRHSPK
jgi:hypothetical protein